MVKSFCSSIENKNKNESCIIDFLIKQFFSPNDSQVKSSELFSEDDEKQHRLVQSRNIFEGYTLKLLIIVGESNK